MTRFVILLFTVSVAALSVGLIAYILQAGLPYVNWNFHVTEPGATMTVQLYLYATEGGAPEWVPYAMAAVLMVFVLFIEILTNLIAAAFTKKKK